MTNKLEFKINTGPNNQKIDISSMSLKDAQTFVIIIEALTKIVENTPENENLKIKIDKGSLVAAVEGDNVVLINNDYNEVINNNSFNGGLVSGWRSIHKVFYQNGYTFDANFRIQNEIISIYQNLRAATKIRTKSVHSPRIETNISFITASLIAVGGKSPNIHIETEDGNKIILSCNYTAAAKAKAFLYKDIYLSAWVRETEAKSTYELCDSYFDYQIDIFIQLKAFIAEFNQATDEIDSLDKIYNRCKFYLDNMEYANFRKFARLFKHETTDVNILKTILIITRSFKEHPELKGTREGLKDLFDKKMKGNK